MWFYDYYIWMMLNNKFMMPAYMIGKGDEMEKFAKHFSLNGIKPMCKM